MRRRRASLGAVVAGLFIAATGVGLPLSGVLSSQAAGTPIYQNTNYSFGERAADLVAHMTLAQLGAEGNSSQAPAIPALGVTIYGWWNESLHGVARYTVSAANATTTANDVIYPDDNSLGSTWDTNLIYNVGTAIGQEARDSAPFNTIDMDYYAPTMNLARDPRWGRNDETYSEDPFEDGQIVSQYVDGMQGEDQNGNLLPSGNGYYQAINTIKHFAAYNNEQGINGSGTGTRLNGNDMMDQRTLLEYDTMPFRTIVEQAHPGSVMTSYPEDNGVPSPASYYLMDTLLRQTFGFTGYVTGDCDTTYEITASHNWQPIDWTRPVNVLERSAVAQAAGNDLTCDKGFADSNNYGTSLPTDSLQGIVTEEDVSFAGAGSSALNDVDTYTANDAQVSGTRLFTARMELGEFDNPQNNPYIQAAQARLAADGVTGATGSTGLTGVYDNGTGSAQAFSTSNAAPLETPARLALARQAGDEALVLLKNAPVGATNAPVGATNVLPLQVPATGTYKIAVVGENTHPASIGSMYDGDYASNQGTAGLAKATDAYTGILNAVKAINPNATVTYIQGDNTTSATASGQSAPDLTNPAGTDAKSLYNLAPTGATNQGPFNAVVVEGFTDVGTGTEGLDRTSITLPGAQASIIQDAYNIANFGATNNPVNATPTVPVIVYMETLGPVDVTSFDDPTPYDPTDTQVGTNPQAILWSGYNAETQGQSLADVLFGAYNPSGRLASTWYHDISDLPPITDYDIRANGPDAPVGATNTPGRTYQYYNGPTSYPFGYGLSYTTYGATNLTVADPAASIGATAGTTATSPINVGANDTVKVTVQATNTGSVGGNDVVELYVNQPNAPASLQRPIERLEGFQMVNIPAGGSVPVTFNIKVPNLAFYNTTDQRWEVDDGLYGITIGSSSAAQDVEQEGYINVSGAMTPTLNVVSAKPVMVGDQARDIQQRVEYPIGTTILPDLTLSMNDDTLYGNIEYGASKACPAGVTVTYSTDQPSVVSVPTGPQTGCTGGTIATLANGAATITANVTYQGVTKSTSFVVRVLSFLSGITVNGNALAGYEPDTYNYDMTLSPGAAVPTVAATDPDPGATVSVTQAPQVPGTATITDTGSDGIVMTYTVNFAYGALSDRFGSSTLGSQWSIVRADPTHWSLTTNPGSLTLTPEQGTLATTTNTAKNIFVQPELGNWTVTTKETWSALPTLAGQQAGLIAYQGDDNYLLFGLLDGSPVELAVTHEDNLDEGVGGFSTTSPNQTVLKTLATSTVPALNGTKTIWLRMSKSGPYYTESYSTDGVNYTTLYEAGDSLMNVKVGVYAFNGTSATATTNTVAFSPFMTTNATTTASLSPSPVDGYYNQNPTVTLSATDPGGPGILNTMYQVDTGGWQAYTGPFKITGDGTHTLQYYSTDDNGDIEATNTQTVLIDTTPPVTTATVSPTPVNGAVNGPATVTLHPTDSFSGVASTYYSINGSAYQLYTAPFQVTRGGVDAVNYYSVDNAGNSESPETLTIQVNPQATTSPTGNVPSTLSVSISQATPSFGGFVAGATATYNTTTGATITSSAASSTLTAADGCTPAATCFPGHLVNSAAAGGPYEMAQGLQVNAASSNPNASGGGTYTDLSVTNPATLLTYSAPVSNDPVTIGFQQPIASTDPLRTGTYTKTITITLSTSTP